MNGIHTSRSFSPVLPPSSSSSSPASPKITALSLPPTDQTLTDSNLLPYSTINTNHQQLIYSQPADSDYSGDGADILSDDDDSKKFNHPNRRKVIHVNPELPLASPLPSPYGAEDDLLQSELDQLTASFSVDSEWTRKLHELEKIENIDDLRQLVLEKERDLHLAARLGLAVAKKNQHIENRLRAYSHSELETQRKLEEATNMNVTTQERWNQEQRERDEELHERFEMITRVNAEVRREIELFREEFQAFRKDVTQINSRVDELSSDLQETNRRLTSASKRIAGLEGDVANTGEVAQELQGQFENVVTSHRHHLSKTKQTIKEMLHNQSRVIKELERLRDNVSILTDRQHFSEERVSGLIEEYTALLTNAQNTIIALNEAHLEADMHSDHSSGVTQVSNTPYMDGALHDYHQNHHQNHNHHHHHTHMNGNGLHSELTSAMSRSSSSSNGQRRITFIRAPRSQLDLRRPSIGLKDLVKSRQCDPSSNGNGTNNSNSNSNSSNNNNNGTTTAVTNGGGSAGVGGGSINGVRVLHSYTLF